MGPVIVTDSLTKKYKTKAVVDQIDLRIPGGSIYGFLGPNGAGKSTTLKMLLGLVKPTEGHIQIFGKEINSKNRLTILSETGSLIEAPAYYGHLSGKENLQIVCTLKNVPEKEIQRVLHIVRMEEQQNKKVSQYSLGMKQRLGLAAALLGNPKILLLDEPTNGLDPAGIQEMRELICSLPASFGITVLISSHLLSEMDQMATHVGIINQGQLIFQDSLNVLHEHSRGRLYLHTSDDQAALLLLKNSGISAQWRDGRLSLKLMDDSRIMRAVALLVNSGIGILRLEEQQMSLEDIFLQLTGKQVSL
ncbi:ATP-binding cassette domain-containing protein [Blautia sp.]|jgi:ABC-type multidrug transport system ATPase subunit|uniref:ATP-binding cassette domain-containing protein n=1 Tax=Blautia sp. TaxID=1955243 RepID=UPI00280C20AF|nr:ATP-binding cassette domain-containing protein [Blautia sp.]MDY3017178.1 ATP-binding cassette domain-containing protein [Blautia sp.]MED9882045.1 ATP-binding cassette domain-containing protein [Blautia sp.]